MSGDGGEVGGKWAGRELKGGEYDIGEGSNEVLTDEGGGR